MLYSRAARGGADLQVMRSLVHRMESSGFSVRQRCQVETPLLMGNLQHSVRGCQEPCREMGSAFSLCSRRLNRTEHEDAAGRPPRPPRPPACCTRAGLTDTTKLTDKI